MKRIRYLPVLLLSCFLVSADFGEVAWPDGVSKIYRLNIDDGSVSGATYAVFHPCRSGQVAADNDDADGRGCIVREDKGETIVRAGFIATAAHTSAAAEDCTIAMETSNSGTATTGTEIASLTFHFGENAAQVNDDCVGRSTGYQINADGDECTKIADTTDSARVVPAGGWWRFRFTTPLGGSCTDHQASAYWVETVTR